MMAAIRSIRQQGATKIVVAVPVASSRAWELIKSADDEWCVLSFQIPIRSLLPASINIGTILQTKK
jgi:predicted phosphoribosyltransferase